MSAGRTLWIAVPGLADSVARLAAQDDDVTMPAAEWLVARGGSVSREPAEWRTWLLADAGLGAGVLERFPAGPCAAAIFHDAMPAGAWARAEPVHLLTAIDHLQLAAPVPLPLGAVESAELLSSLNAHLAGTGFALHACTDGGWLCEVPPDLECSTVEPSRAVGRNLRDWLPTGRDASRLRSLLNELQMLLHEHPVNERRAARGQPAVNSVWPWGLGTLGKPQATAPGVLLGDDPWLDGLWRVHGGRVRPLDEFAAALAEEHGDIRVALTLSTLSSGVTQNLRDLDDRYLAPARAWLAGVPSSRVMLHAGSRCFEVTGRARWAFWRRVRPLVEVLA